jgi:hypothetical protein
VSDARQLDGPEVAGTVVDDQGKPKPVGGRPWTYVDRVSQPTLTVYSPEGINTGAASSCFPAGATTSWPSTSRERKPARG